MFSNINQLDQIEREELEEAEKSNTPGDRLHLCAHIVALMALTGNGPKAAGCTSQLFDII